MLREVRFVSREEMQGISRVYPEYLRDEFWKALECGAFGSYGNGGGSACDTYAYDPFRIR